MKTTIDKLELLNALKQAYTVAYNEYLSASPEGVDLSRAHADMVATRRAYHAACVDLCDDLVKKKYIRICVSDEEIEDEKPDVIDFGDVTLELQRDT